MSKPEYDLCVIGGGAAGLVVAAGGAALGARVALVEKQALGGDCLYHGCVPSKALLQCAKVAHTARNAVRFGVDAAAAPIDMGKIMRRVGQVIDTLAVHDSPERFRGLGVEVIFGAGRFADQYTFVVDDRHVTARKFVLATGSHPFIPAIDGLSTIPYLTNETLFTMREDVPELIIVGAGPVGMEMAQAFARLGSRVRVVQRGARVLPREDADLTEVVAGRLRDEGVKFNLGHTPLRVEGTAGKIRLAVVDEKGWEKTVEGTHLLLAAGRRGNVDGLGLDAAGVRVEHGYVATDTRLRTRRKHIYACGDVTGRYQFTHMAEHQAGVVLRNALFHLPSRAEEHVVPWCTFTDPELARVGLSEEEAQRQGVRHRVYTFPFENIDRAQTDGEACGFAKIITSPKGRLLGAALAGPHAGELIHEYVLALSKGMRAQDLSRVIHIYPTLAQINRRVADVRMKERLTPVAGKWIKRIFGLRGK